MLAPTPTPRPRGLLRLGLLRQRIHMEDLAVAAGYGLLCIGALPMLEIVARKLLRPASPAHEDPRSGGYTNPTTAADHALTIVALVLALLGSTMVLLRATPLPTSTKTRRLALLLCALALATVFNLSLLMTLPTMTTTTTTAPKFLRALDAVDQWRVNNAFCQAHAARVCSHGDVATARRWFPLATADDNGEDLPGAQPVAVLCANVVDSAQANEPRQWPAPQRMPERLCGLCDRVLQSVTDDDPERHFVDPWSLTAMGPPTPEDRGWCRTLLLNYRTDDPRYASPYDQRRRDRALPPPPTHVIECELLTVVAAAKALVPWSLVGLIALSKWLRDLQHAAAAIRVDKC